MAQTATQWLRKEVSKLGTRSRFYHDVMGLIDEAEKKEKEQIAKAYDTFVLDDNSNFMTAEQYYNETFNKTQAQ
jgi:N12 class adenine-specific DNA methylase